MPTSSRRRDPAAGPGVPGHRPYGDEVTGVVGIALVDDLTRPRLVLAARRSDRTAPGGWELPGGKVEPGESWEAAAHRELAEELGVAIRLGAFVPGPSPGGLWPLGASYAMAVWLAVAIDGTPTPGRDHDELRWLGRHELGSVGWLPGDLPAVRAVGELLIGGERVRRYRDELRRQRGR